VHPCAIRYEHADGSICRAMAYVGELSFMQSLGLAIRQRGVVARVSFAPAMDATGSSRRELAAAAHARIASLLGLPAAGTAPRTAADPPAGPQ
jgi:1-acyl-sn-glycerol-3-phosphate acyltransferase